MDTVETKDSAFIEDELVYNKPTKAVPAPEKKRDIDLDKTLYDNIIAAGLSSQLDITAFNSLSNKAQNRNEMYNVFDIMCEDGTIAAVIETYAEDATERNDSGNIVWVEAEDSEIGRLVEYYLDTLNVNKNIFKWVHSLCKYGDVYIRLYRESDYNDDIFGTTKPQQLNESVEGELNEDVKIKSYKKSDNYAHYMEMVANPAEMFEVTKFGKTVGYLRAPVTNTLDRQDNLTYTTYQYKFRKQDVEVYPATEFVHAALESNVSRDEEVISIFTTQEDYDSDSNALKYKVRRGQSMLSDVYKTWRNLNLLENAVLLYRLTKSSRVRIVNVEVGDMPKENVGKTLRGIKQMVEQKSALRENTSMSEYNNAGPIENTIYVPTHEGKGTISTSELGGDVDVKSLADLDYYTNKLYGQLRVPKQYFSQTDDSTGFNGGSSLSIISSRYAKMIKRIQNTIIQAITDAINLMLIDKGLDAYVNEFTIQMLPPTTQEEIDRRDNLSSKVQLSGDIMNMLADIEDPVVKFKILKSLLSNIIDDTDIIDELQGYIENMESEQPEEDLPTDDMGEEGFEDDVNMSMGGSSLNNTFDPSIGDDMETEGEEETDSGEDILPSGDDLGVDLTDSGEE